MFNVQCDSAMQKHTYIKNIQVTSIFRNLLSIKKEKIFSVILLKTNRFSTKVFLLLP